MRDICGRYAAKMEHEGAAMYDAAAALRDAMIELGLACDGGKDSLSMAAGAGGEVCPYCYCQEGPPGMTSDLLTICLSVPLA